MQAGSGADPTRLRRPSAVGSSLTPTRPQEAMTETASWLTLAGLGAFHGLNPGMGWLFAVALGLHRQDRKAVWLALVPIALGHALAIAATTLLLLWAGLVIDASIVRVGAGL